MKIRPSLTAVLLLLTTFAYSQVTVFSSGDFDFEILKYYSTAVKLKALDRTLKGDIVIPDSVTYKGTSYAVTQIENMGDNPNVQSISIPKTVNSISGLYNLVGLQNFFVDGDNPYYSL